MGSTVDRFRRAWDLHAPRVLDAAIEPRRLVARAWRLLPLGSTELRSKFDAVMRPPYAYGAVQAARLARALGLPGLTLIEFGVGGGRGLIELDRLATDLSREMRIDVRAFGFDTGSGLPAPRDYRDLPYVWKPGFYRCDIDALRARLRRAELILGDVAETVPAFLRREEHPVGFVAFDLDFYSSTAAALRLFDAPVGRLLPRVLSYFDDIVGPDEELHSEFTGELLAIREFNDGHAHRKIARINGLRDKRLIPCTWAEQMFALHAFDHPAYNHYVYPAEYRG